MTGQGSNGKSLLLKLRAAAFGPEIHHSMEAFLQDGCGNNDDLVDVMENTDSRRVNEKLFKSITGGDQLQVSAKYKVGQKIEPQMKLTFFNNDCPLWSAQCYALNRRCWNLPMRAQFLDYKTDEKQIQVLKSEGRENWIFPINPDLDFGTRSEEPPHSSVFKMECIRCQAILSRGKFLDSAKAHTDSIPRRAEK